MVSGDDGWAVFETVQPGTTAIMFADGIAYEARSPTRVLGRQRGARFLQVVARVVDTTENVNERINDQTVVGHAITGPTGVVHAVAVWIGNGEPPSRPAVASWDIDLEKGTSSAGGELNEVWDDGRAEKVEYAWQSFLTVAHPDDVIRMTRLVTQFVDAEPGLLRGLRWSVKRGDGWAALQTYGRLVVVDGARLWRGHSIDLTGLDELQPRSRSVVGMLATGADQQVALVDLVGAGPAVGPHVIRWLHEGLPAVLWPENGWLGAIVHPEDQAFARFDLAALAAQPVEQVTTTQFRMRSSTTGWVAVEMTAHLVDDPTSETAPAMARFTLAEVT